MLDFRKILLPINLEEPSLPAAHQAAVLARHFHSQIVMLHVVRTTDFLGVHDLTQKEVLAERVSQAEAQIDSSTREELDGISVKRVVLQGEPAVAVLQAARDEQVNVIVMDTQGHSGVPYFLVGSVTAQMLCAAEFPIWTAPHSDKQEPRLAIRNVLCGVDFSIDEVKRIHRASELAREFGAKLTLAHVTPAVETYAPGGHFDVHGVTKQLTHIAAAKIAQLQKETRVQADVFIASGDVAAVLDEAAKQTNADVLVIGRRPRVGWIGDNAYPIISRSHIPVLSI